jgi:hypothetical protein
MAVVALDMSRLRLKVLAFVLAMWVPALASAHPLSSRLTKSVPPPIARMVGGCHRRKFASILLNRRRS